MSVTILTGDCLDVLKTAPDASVHTCVTSPPYWGLRDYGHAGQLGLEPTPDAYVASMVRVFQEVRRALRDDGTLWLNLGDSYAANRGSGASGIGAKQLTNVGANLGKLICPEGFKPKDLIGIPWRVAFALQADGWYLRSDIIWSKPNPMPESVTDRPTKAHEYIFLLSKSASYYYDAEAIAEPLIGLPHAPGNLASGRIGSNGKTDNCVHQADRVWGESGFRNKRTVWTVTTKPYSGAHFATFPPDLIEPCILAGCPVGGAVLDPFGGAGTTGLVADRLQRNALLIELNPEYAELARNRIQGDSPLFAEVA